MAEEARVHEILRALKGQGRFVLVENGRTQYAAVKEGANWEFGIRGEERESLGSYEAGEAEMAEIIRSAIDQGMRFTAMDRYDYGKGRQPPKKL